MGDKEKITYIPDAQVVLPIIGEGTGIETTDLGSNRDDRVCPLSFKHFTNVGRHQLHSFGNSATRSIEQTIERGDSPFTQDIAIQLNADQETTQGIDHAVMNDAKPYLDLVTALNDDEFLISCWAEDLIVRPMMDCQPMDVTHQVQVHLHHEEFLTPDM
ncbi:hypothetical protein D3C78_1080690 [compost metagenome]